MMKRTKLFLILFAVLALAAISYAQNEEKTEEKWRNFEFSAVGGLSIPTGDLKNWNDSMGAKTGIEFGGSGGYYFTDKFCLGTYFSYTQHSMELYDLHYKTYDVGSYVKYAFTGESNFEPYLKVMAGVNFIKFPTWVTSSANRLREVSYNGGISAALGMGLLYYTSDNGGVFLEASFHHTAGKDNKGTHLSEEYYLKDNFNYLQIRGGLTVFFGPES